MKTLILFLVSSFAFAADNRPADEKAVRAAVEQFLEAARKGDGAGLDKLLSADLAYAHSSAMVEDKAQCIAALVKSKPNFVLEPGSTVQIHGGGTTAIFRTKVIAGSGTPNKLLLRMVQVWVKDGGAWKMVERNTVRVP